jgi:hypothetical protein
MKPTNQQTQDRDTDAGLPPPRTGDRFRCAGCGMEVEVKFDCRCATGDPVHFHCCGQELTPAGRK